MTQPTNAITAPDFQNNNHHDQEVLQNASLVPIRYNFLQECFNNLSEINLDNFHNTENLTFTFQKHVVFNIVGDFVNPVGMVFSLVKGFTIRAQSIKYAGELSTTEGFLCLEATNIEHATQDLNKPCKILGAEGVQIKAHQFTSPKEGSIESSIGPVEIFTQADLLLMGLIKAGDGIALISEEGAISFLNSVLITPNKTLLIQTKKPQLEYGITDQQSQWEARSIALKSPGSTIQLVSTRVPSGLLFVSSAHAKIHSLWQQAGCPVNVQAEHTMDITNSTFGAGVTLNANDMVRLDDCHGDSLNQPISIQSRGPIAMRNFHIRNAESLAIDGHKLLIHSSTVECNKGLTVKSHKKTTVGEGFAGVVHQGPVLFESKHLALSDIKLSSKDTQKIKADTADLTRAHLESDGTIKLKTEELGTYEETIVTSNNGSVKFESQQDLAFIKTTTFAKKNLSQHAAVHLVDEESTHGAIGNLTQSADLSINSTNSHLETRGDLSLKTEQIKSVFLTAIAQNIKAETSEDGCFIQGTFFADKEVSLISTNSYLNLSETEITAGQLFVDAVEQIYMQNSKTQVNGKAEWSSRKKWIKAQHAQITGTSNDKKQGIVFTAPEGSLYLDDVQVHSQQKARAYAKSVHTENGVIDAQQGVVLAGTRVQAESAHLSSDNEIVLDGTKSLVLDRVQKNAPQIIEMSKDWISETHNENDAEEIFREASDITVTKTHDRAKMIQNEAAQHLYLSNYSAEAEERITLSSKDTVSIQKSDLKAPTLDVKADKLWLESNALYFNALDVKAQNLQAQENSVIGGQSSFHVGEGTITDNLLQTAVTHIEADNDVVFQNNQSAGNLKLKSQGDQSIVNNRLSSGDVYFESKEGSLSLQNNVISDVPTAEINAPSGSAHLSHNTIEVTKLTLEAQQTSMHQDDISTKKDVIIKGKEFNAEQTQIVSIGKIDADDLKKINLSHTALDGGQVALDTSQLTLSHVDIKSSEKTQLTFDTGNVVDTKILAASDLQIMGATSLEGKNVQISSEKSDVTVYAPEQLLREAAIQGNNVEQHAKDLKNINMTVDAVQTLTREADNILIAGGIDHGKQVSEKSKKSMHHQHATFADQSHELHSTNFTALNSAYEAPEIKWNSNHIYGSENAVHANTFSIESKNIHQSKGNFEAGKTTVKTDKGAFPLSELRGEVVFEEFFELDLRKVIVRGSLQAGAEETAVEMQEVPVEVQALEDAEETAPYSSESSVEMQEIDEAEPSDDEVQEGDQPMPEEIDILVNQIIQDKRKFPTTFEGVETAPLARELRQRGVLRVPDDLFIDDGEGRIDTQRILSKLMGANPPEVEILLRHFSNAPDAFGIRHGHLHWTYLRLLANGQHQEVTTLGDGNCAFNGFVLGWCEAILSGKITLTPAQLEFFKNALGLANPTIENLQAWITPRTLHQRQTELQGILRRIAVSYIVEHEAEIYRDSYEQQLWNAYCDQEGDDTFRIHTHIARKFNERNLEENALKTWWHTEGKGPYFDNMRQGAWGAEVELDALARCFGISIFWQKETPFGQLGTRSIGGKAIQGFNEEQIKRFRDLGIGEQVGNSFQLNRFASLAELQEKIRPIHTDFRELVERILAEKARTALEIPTMLPENASLVLRERGIITGENTLLADAEGKLAFGEIRNRLNALNITPSENEPSENASLENSLLESLAHAVRARKTLDVPSSIRPDARAITHDRAIAHVRARKPSSKPSVVSAPGLEVYGKSLGLTASVLLMPGAQVTVQDQITLNAEKEADLSDSHLLARKISLAAGNVHAPEMHATAQEKIEIFSEGHTNFQNGEFQAASFDVQSKQAHFSYAHIEADTFIKADDQVNLAGATNDGPLKVESDGSITAANLTSTGDYVVMSANSIWTPGVRFKTKHIMLASEKEITVQNGHLTAEGSIATESNYLNAQGTHAEAQEIELLADNLANLQNSEMRSASAVIKSNHVDLQKAQLEAKITIEGAQHVKANEAIIHGTFKADSVAFEGSGLNATVDSFEIDTEHLLLQHAQVNAQTQIDIVVIEEASLQHAHLNVADGGLVVDSKNLNADGLQVGAKENVVFPTEGVAQLQDADIKTDAIVGIEAAYLTMNDAHVEAGGIVEKGTFGISAVKSEQTAQTVLKQKSKFGIDDEGASLQAGKLTQQKAKYINRRNAVNKAPLNIFQTTLLDNQKSEIEGNFEIETHYLLNQDAKLMLGAETSNIVAGAVFSSSHTAITGEGDLQMDISGDHQENSRVNMDGTYMLKATKIEVKTPLTAKNARLHATQGNIVVAKGAPINVKGIAELDCVSLDNNDKIRADILTIQQKNYRDPRDVKGKHYLELSSDSHIAIEKPMTIEEDFALKSKVGIDINQPLNVGGKGIFETPGNVEMNVQSVFQKGMDVEANEFNINNDIHVTGNSAFRCNKVNLNAKADNSRRKRYGFLRRRGKYTSTHFHHHGDLDWEVGKTVIDGSNFHVKGKMLAKGGVIRVISQMHTKTYEKKVGKVKSKKWGGLKKTSKTLYATCQKIVVDLFAVLQVENGLYVDNASVIIEGGAFLGKLAEGHANKISVGIQSLQGESPTALPPFQKAPGLPTPRPGGDWQTTGDTSLSVNDFYVNGYFESTQGRVNVAAKKFLVECRVAEKDEQVAKISRSGGIHRRTVKTDDSQPGAHVHGALGTHIHIEESGVLRGGTVSSGGLTHFTGQHLTEEPVALRKVVHLKPGQRSFFKQFSGIAQMREIAGEQLVKNKRLPGMPKTPVNVDPSSYFRKVRAYSKRREYVPSNIIGKELLIDLDGNFNCIASHATGFDGVIIRAANISKRELFDSYKSQTSQRGKGKSEIQTVTVTDGSIRCINGPVELDAKKGDLYLEGEVGSFKGHVTLKALRDISLITRSQSAENKVSSTTYSFPKVTHQTQRYNSVTILRARVFGTGLTVDAGRNFITEAPDVDISGDASIKANYWERRGHKINLHHQTKEMTVGVKFFGSEAIASAVNEKKPLRTAMELFKENPSFNLLCQAVGGSKDGVAAAKSSVTAAVSTWNEFSKYSKAFNNDQLGNSLGHDYGITDAEGNFKPKITIEAGASQSKTRWTTTIPAEFHIQGNYKEDVKVVRDKGAQFSIGGNTDINNDIRILDSEVDTFHQSGRQGKLGVGYGASGWSFSAEYAQSSAKGKTHTPHRMNIGGDLKMNVRHLVLNGSAYIEAEHAWIKVDKLSGETVANTYRQKSISGGGSTDERVSFSASSAKKSQVADVMTIKSRQPGHITANTVHSKGGLFQNITFNPDAKLHFEDVKEYNKTWAVSGQYFGKNTRKSPKDEEEGIKIWGDVDLITNSQKGKVRATITGGNGEAFPGINTDIDRHHTKGKDRKLHLGAPIMTVDPDILEANAQEIGRAFGLSQPPAPPPVVNDMPKMPPKLIVKKSMPKIAENTSSETLQEPPQPQEKAKKEEAQPKPKTQEVEPKKTAEKTPPPAEKRTQKPAKTIASPKTAEEKALEEMYSKIREHRIQGMTDIHRLAMPLYAMDYVAELAIGKFIDMSKDTSLSGRIQWHMMMSSLLMPSPPMQAAYTLYPLLEDKFTDLSNKSDLTDFVGKFLTDYEKDISDDWKNRKGVIGFAAKTYSAYQDYIERQVVLNRKFNIPDANTRQYYADLTKIGEAAVLTAALGGAGKLLKAAKPLMTKQGITTFLRNDSGAVPLLERVFKLTAREESYLPAPYSPAVQKFVDKMFTVVEKHAPEGRTLSTSLAREEEEIASAIRNVAYFGNERLKVWSGMVQERGVVNCTIDFIENPLFRELPSFKPKGNFIVKVESNEGFSAIIKQKKLSNIIQEASGLDTFRSLQTKYLHAPEILDIGQYLGKYVLMTTRLRGDPIASWMKIIGSHVVETPERDFLFQHLVKVSLQLGKEVGGLQTKGLQHKHWQPKDFSNRAAGIEEAQKGVNRMLKDMNLQLVDINSRHLQSLVTDLEKSPETLTFGFGPIRDHHFLVSPENTSIGFIGARNIPFTVNALKKPNVFPAEEYFSFLGLYDKGIRYGLTPKEAHVLKQAFMRGHSSTFSGEVTHASQQFFNLSAQSDTLLELGDAFNKGIIKDKAVIGKYVDRLNHSIKPSEMSSNSWTTLARDFLKDDVGGAELPARRSLIQPLTKNEPRTIQKRTPLIPEHIGIPSEVFYEGRVPFQPLPRHLEGWVTLEKETLKVRLNNISVREGELLYWKSAMGHLLDLARHNNAKILHFEANFINPKFERVMNRLYGPAKEELRFSKKEDKEILWHVFKIPVESDTSVVKRNVI